MYLSKEQVEIIIRTIFGAMWQLKEPIYLFKVLWNNYLNLLRKYIISNQNKKTKINDHDLYIILEWLYEVKENIDYNDYETVTWFSINDLIWIISYIEEYFSNNNIIFDRIK